MLAKVCSPARTLAVVLLVAVVSVAPFALAQERPTDTLRVVDRAIKPGDTADVYFYITNSERLGGYSVRVQYDTSMLGAVMSIDDNTYVVAAQLRGDFSIFAFVLSTPDIVSGIAAFSNPNGLDVGSGNTIRMRFYAKPYAPEGTTVIRFIDHPDDTNYYNWFAAFSGFYQYRPTRIDGSIWIGCDCPHQGDNNQDGEIDAQDVLLTAKQIYRYSGTSSETGTRCPMQVSDWNCDGCVNPLDLVRLVIYLYEAPAPGPCDPCAP